MNTFKENITFHTFNLLLKFQFPCISNMIILNQAFKPFTFTFSSTTRLTSRFTNNSYAPAECQDFAWHSRGMKLVFVGLEECLAT